MMLKLIKSPVELTRTHDTALITGDGRTCTHDIYEFLQYKVPHDVISIGRSINVYDGPIQHWANVDGADSKWWAEHLPLKNNGKVPLRHTIGDMPWYDVIWDDGLPDGTLWQGSTALFATLIALHMGYLKIVLAGCPLDENGHWYHDEDVKGPTWEGSTYRKWLDLSTDDDFSKVRSLSGYTAKIVGQVHRDWLKGV